MSETDRTTARRIPRISPFWRVVGIGGWYFLLATAVPLAIAGATGTPKFELEELTVYAIIAAAAPLVLNRYLDGRSREAIGVFWDQWVARDLGAGVIIGLTLVAIQAAVYVILTSRPVDVPPLDVGLLVTIISAVAFHTLVAVTEELQDRGHFLTTVTEWTTGWVPTRVGIGTAIVFVAVFFSISHVPETSGRFIALVCSGILYGIAYAATGRLGLPIGLHLGRNVGTELVTWDNYVVQSVGNVEIAMVVILGGVELSCGGIVVISLLKISSRPSVTWCTIRRAYDSGER